MIVSEIHIKTQYLNCCLTENGTRGFSRVCFRAAKLGEAAYTVESKQPALTRLGNSLRGSFLHHLSQSRAESVVAWLKSHGVERSRLSAKGYGPTRPIETNTTEEGRQTNRRVEFHIVGDTTLSSDSVEQP